MDTDDYTRPLEAVMRDERKPRPLPLKARDHLELFEEWMRLNPDAMREIELTALAIDARGLRVSTKYLIEKQRYEGGARLNPVTFYDDQGMPHVYGINNTITPLLARWLLKRHPEMNIYVKHSYFDDLEEEDEA
ncbi:hypothetical protein [Rubneribacter sp.]